MSLCRCILQSYVPELASDVVKIGVGAPSSVAFSFPPAGDVPLPWKGPGIVPIHESMPGPSVSQSAMCFLLRKVGGAVLAEPGVVVEVAEEGMGEEEVASADGADPGAAIGDDDGTPPLTVAVDAMVGRCCYFSGKSGSNGIFLFRGDLSVFHFRLQSSLCQPLASKIGNEFCMVFRWLTFTFIS